MSPSSEMGAEPEFPAGVGVREGQGPSCFLETFRWGNCGIGAWDEGPKQEAGRGEGSTNWSGPDRSCHEPPWALMKTGWSPSPGLPRAMV